MSKNQDFKMEGKKLRAYKGPGGDVVVPDGVIKICSYAFEGCASLTRITLPEGVEEIDVRAFQDCTNLTEVVLPSSLTNVHSSAFCGCTSLTQITIPKGVKELDWDVFQNCTGLKQVTIPEGVETLGQGVFQGCTSLTHVTLPEGVVRIGRSAFQGCTGLTGIDLPDSVTEIEADAFRDCASLTSFTIPKQVSFRDWNGLYNAFAGCPKLKELRVAEGNPYLTVENGALYNQDRTVLIAWPSAEGQAVLPSTVRSLGNQAFAGCTGLTGLTISGNVEKGARYDRERLSALAFTGCVNLTNFQVDPEHPTLYGEGGALYRRGKDGPVLVSWPAARGAVVVPDGVTWIGESAFQGCTALTQITLPASVTQFSHNAFHDCTNLAEVILPDGVEFLNSGVFSGCTSLKHIKLPAGLTWIGNGVFQGCSALEELTFPQGVTSIYFDSFDGCTHLKRITLPETVEEIRNYFPGNPNYPRFAVETTLLRTMKKRSNGLTNLVYFTGGEDLAYVVLYQGGKAWQEAVQGRVGQDPTLAEDVVLALNRLLTEEKRPKKAEWERAAAFVLKRQKQVKTETLQAFCDLAREKKSPVLTDLESDSGVRRRITLGSGQETQAAAQAPENPVERMVFERWKTTPTVKKLQKLVKQGVRYAGSEELCSKDALIWLAARPVDALEELEDVDEVLNVFQKELDPIAAGLDRTALMEFLDTMVFSGSNIKLFIPAYCRYADEEQMEKLVKQMKAWHQWSLYGATGRNYESCAQESIYYSETKTAMRNCTLKYYAAMRGTDEQTLRDTVLADLGLDQEGKRFYDLGSKTVEARMAEDLTLTLYDPEAGKVVKSMPKKGTDPEKYEAAKKDFARLKKDIRAAVKERTNLLFQRFLDGEGQKGEDWKKVYFQNPMLKQIARLLVWSQDQKTFTMTPQGTADAAGQPYEVGDKPVKVAHPMEMEQEDLARWQKYFTSHGLKQPFEQVWEPLVNFDTVQENRYKDMILPANQLRGQEKHGITFEYQYDTCMLWTGFADLSLDCGFTHAQGHFLEPDATVIFGKLKVKKAGRAANHVLARLDKWLAAERVKKDDATVVDILDSFTLAQVTELLNLAIENQCVNCTAALLEYKNQKFPDFDPMEIFTLE